MKLPIRVLRVWRVVKRAPHRALHDWVGVVLNEHQLFAVTLAVLTSWLGLQTASLPKVIEEANAWGNALQAAIYVALGWAAICLFRAPLVIVREERLRGTWQGHHYTYHERHLLASARLLHEDGETQSVVLDTHDLEPGAMVYVCVEVTPNVAQRVLTYLGSGPASPQVQIPAPSPGVVTLATHPGAYIGTRVSPTGKLTLYVRIEPQTVPTTVRAYCNQFFLGMDDEKY